MALSTSLASLSLQQRNNSSVGISSFSGVSLKCSLRVARLQTRYGASSPGPRAAMAGVAEAGAEGRNLEEWVRQMLPGGFAAQRLIGTGRRKTAVARVVLIDGTGQIVINGRTAKVSFTDDGPLTSVAM